MIKKTFFACTCLYVLLGTVAEPPPPQYGVPFSNGGGVPINSYGSPNYNTGDGRGGQGGHDHAEPKSYEFGYQVKDEYSGNDYRRQEKSDGNQVQGEYRVQLPDGRTQIVTYYADWETGYHADVRYEGEAQYPDQYNGRPGYNQGGYEGQGGYTGQGGYAGQGGYGTQGNFGGQGGNAQGYNQGGYAGHGQYDNQGYNYNAAASNTILVKNKPDSTYNPENYNTGYNINAINDGLSFNGNYDSYDRRGKPSTAYGTP